MLSHFTQVTCYLKSQPFCLALKQGGRGWGSAVLKNKSQEGIQRGGELPTVPRFSVTLSLSKECRWREMEEHRQAERLQRQLQQEQAYLLSLQHDHRRPHAQQPPPPPQQQDRSKPSYHAPEPKPHYDPADRAREVPAFPCCFRVVLRKLGAPNAC